jgi:murein DD-endopeptidase MepM/ murein hydrolase activator NlpD
VLDGVVTSLCGPRVNPVTGKNEFHDGLDIACPVGTDIYATFYGTVAATGNSKSLGNYIRLAYSNGYSALYAHLSKVYVETGDEVNQGDIIALSGNTGQSTGPHLHYSIHKGSQFMNAYKYVALPVNDRLTALGGGK